MPIIPHCLNGVTDNGEESCDCGGDCDPCVYYTVPCSSPVNEVRVTESSDGHLYTAHFNSANITRGNYDNGSQHYYKVDAQGDSLHLVFYFERQLHVPNRIYEAGNTSATNIVHVQNASLINSYGNVYLNEINGKYVIGFCDLYLNNDWDPWTSYQYRKITGNITCN